MKYENNTRGVLARIRQISYDRAKRAANMVVDHILKEMAKPKSGIEYTVPGTNVKYTASAPGEYPAIRMGELRDNIEVTTEVDALSVSGLINVKVPHGAILEAGMRPFLSRAADEKADGVRAIYEAPWDI